MKNKKSIGLPGGPNEFLKDITRHISVEGYKRYSKDVNNPYNIIESGNITMEDVDFPVYGTDNLGNEQIMMPGNNYQFPGDSVLEVPMAQEGGPLPQYLKKRKDGNYKLVPGNLPEQNSKYQSEREWMLNWINNRPEQIRTLADAQYPKNNPIKALWYDNIASDENREAVYNEESDRIKSNLNKSINTVTYKGGVKVPGNTYMDAAAGSYSPYRHDIHFPTRLNRKAKLSTVAHETAHASRLDDYKGTNDIIRETLKDDTVYEKVKRPYYRTHSEIQARIFGLRRNLNFKPTEKVTKELLKEKIKVKKEKGYIDYQELDNIMTEDSMIKLMNKLVSNDKTRKNVVAQNGGWLSKYENGSVLPKAQVGKEQATISQYEEPAWYEKALDRLASPMTAFGYSARNQDIPDNLPINMEERNAFDSVIDMFNPFAWIKYGAQADRDLEKSEYLDAGLNALGAIPVVPTWLKYGKYAKDINKLTRDLSKPIINKAKTNLTQFINDPVNINNPFGFQRIGDTQPLSDLSLLTPENIDLTKGFGNYAEELSKRQRAYSTKYTDENLSENYFEELARLRDQTNKNITPFGKPLGSGMEGTVYEFANYPESVLKHAYNYSNKLSDINLPKEAMSFRNNATAIPLKGEKIFDNFNNTEGAISMMDNLNKVGLDAPLQLSKRDSYADLLKRIRKLRDSEIRIDANNRSNIRFNKDKGVYDIYDLQPGKGNPTYMKWIDQELRPGQMIPDKGSQFDYMDGGALPQAQLGGLGRFLKPVIKKGIKYADELIDDAISNVYKYNPTAYNNINSKLPEFLQLNKNNEKWLRQVGKPAIVDAQTTRTVREIGEKIDPKAFALKLQELKNVQPGQFQINKRYNGPFFKKGETFFKYNKIARSGLDGLPNTRGRSGSADFLMEFNPSDPTKYKGMDSYFQPAYMQVMQMDPKPFNKFVGDIGIMKPKMRDVDNFDFYKKDWLKGYKKTPLDELQPGGETGEYKVQKGDTFYGIANKNNVPWNALKESNPNINTERLDLNQNIIIPKAINRSPPIPKSGPSRKFNVLDYNTLSNYLVDSRGGTIDTWGQLADTIAFHESSPWSRMDPKAKQYKGGPGRGLFQFEGESFNTALKRYKNIANAKGFTIKDSIVNAKSADELSSKDQYALFLANLIESKAKLSDYANGKLSSLDVWLLGHKNVEADGDRASFLESKAAAEKEGIKNGYKTFQKGGEIENNIMYKNYINGVYRGSKMESKAEKIYDKLNRLHYRDAKANQMTPANYVLTHVIG